MRRLNVLSFPRHMRKLRQHVPAWDSQVVKTSETVVDGGEATHCLRTYSNVSGQRALRERDGRKRTNIAKLDARKNLVVIWKGEIQG